MHEFSIAEALIDLVKYHLPAGSLLRGVMVEAGPMRGIDPDAMQFAWQSITPGTCCESARLELLILPWKMRCPACHQQFESPDRYVECSCGHPAPYPDGGDDLRLVALDIDPINQVTEVSTK